FAGCEHLLERLLPLRDVIEHERGPRGLARQLEQRGGEVVELVAPRTHGREDPAEVVVDRGVVVDDEDAEDLLADLRADRRRRPARRAALGGRRWVHGRILGRVRRMRAPRSSPSLWASREPFMVRAAMAEVCSPKPWPLGLVEKPCWNSRSRCSALIPQPLSSTSKRMCSS